MKIIYLSLILLTLTCQSVQHKPEFQVAENKQTLALIDDVRNLITKSELPVEDKNILYSTLAQTQSSIAGSTETIEDCIEFKSRAMAANHEAKLKIKKQAKIIWVLIGLLLLRLLPDIIRILYRFTPVGMAINQLKSEIMQIFTAR